MVLRLPDSWSNWNLEMLVFKRALSNVTCRIPMLIAAVKYITEMHIVLNCFVLFFRKIICFCFSFLFYIYAPNFYRFDALTRQQKLILFAIYLRSDFHLIWRAAIEL